MTTVNPTGRTLANQDDNAVAITGGTIAGISNFTVSRNSSNHLFVIGGGDTGNLQWEVRTNGTGAIYEDWAISADGGSPADYDFRQILTGGTLYWQTPGSVNTKSWNNGLVSTFQAGCTFQSTVSFAAASIATAALAGANLRNVEAQWSAAANGQALRKNPSTGAIEPFTPSAGGGISLTSLSAVAPIAYDNTTGTFSTSIATGTIAGRATAATGVIEALTPTQARSVMGLGSAALSLSTDFATAAQGTLAGTALQPGAIGSTVQGFSARLSTIATTSNPATQKHIGLNTDGTIGFVEGARLNTIAVATNPATIKTLTIDTSGNIILKDDEIGTNTQAFNTNLTQIAAVASQTAYGQALLAATQTSLRNSVFGSNDYQVSSTKPTTNSLGGALVAGNVWIRSTDWTSWRYLSGTDWISTARQTLTAVSISISIPIGSTSVVTSGTAPATSTVTVGFIPLAGFKYQIDNVSFGYIASATPSLSASSYTFNVASRGASTILNTVSGLSSTAQTAVTTTPARVLIAPNTIIDATSAIFGVTATCTYSIPSNATAQPAHSFNVTLLLVVREII